jgi:hypothetical protein
MKAGRFPKAILNIDSKGEISRTSDEEMEERHKFMTVHKVTNGHKC